MIGFFIERPRLVNMLAIVAVLLALILSPKVQREYLPSVNMPRLIITATLPGASAEDMQQEITIPIEEAVAEIDGIDKFYSTISNSVSSTSIELYIDSSEEQVQAAMQDLRDALAAITDFPPSMTEAPILKRLNPGKLPVVEVALSGPMDELAPVAIKLEKRLEKLTDISRVDIIGLQDPEIRVLVDPLKAKNYGVPVTDVVAAIKNRNLSGTGGSLKTSESLKQVVAWGRYNADEEISNTFISSPQNLNTLQVRDLARIERDREDTRLLTHTNGQSGLSLLVRKRESADALNAVDRVRNSIDQLEIPEAVSYSLVDDDTFYTRNRLQVMLSNGIMGLALVSFILMLFMRFSSAIWVLFGIPIVFCGALICLIPLGLTFNLFTLTGLVIVLGMVVDDAVVVTENVIAHRERGMKPAEAALIGAKEMLGPVLASAITTALAFGPIVAMGGIPGKVLWQIPAMVVLVLIFSLIETFFMLPSHLSLLRSADATEKLPWIQKLETQYRRALKYCLRKRATVITVAFISFGFVMVVVRPLIEFEQFPQTDARTLFLKLSAPIGTPLEKTEAIALDLQSQIQSLTQNDFRAVTARIGHQDDKGFERNRGEAEHEALITLFLKDLGRQHTNQQWIDILEDSLILPAGSSFTLQSEYVGPPTDQPVTVHILSNNTSIRRQVASEIANFVRSQEGTTQVNIDERQGTSKIDLNLDYQKLNALGLNIHSVTQTLQAAFLGVEASEIRDTQNVTAIRVQFSADTHNSLDSLLNSPIRNSSGALVSLRDAIKPVSVQGVDRIYHRDGTQASTVRASFTSDSKNTALSFSKKLDRELLYQYRDIPELEVIVGGEAADTIEATKNLATVGFLVIIAITLTVWLTLGSLVKAMVAIIAIPFAIAGVVLAFFIHGMSLSMTALVGTIGLAGVVANASIVMLDAIDRAQSTNKGIRSSKELAEDAVVSRLRPILITTLTTLGGVLPTAYGLGGYDSIISPMSIAIGWGLAFSTLVTLFLVPVLLSTATSLQSGFNYRLLTRRGKGNNP